MANNLVVQLLLKTGTFSTDLKTARGQVQNFQKGCQNAGQSLNGFAGALGINVGALTKFGGAIGGAVAAGQALKGIIDSTQTSADAFDGAIAGCKGVVDALAVSIASADFSTFQNGLWGVFDAAKAARDALDDLQDAQLGYGMLSSRNRREFTEAQTAYKEAQTNLNNSKTKEERDKWLAEMEKQRKKMEEAVINEENASKNFELKNFNSIKARIRARNTNIQEHKITADMIYEVAEIFNSANSKERRAEAKAAADAVERDAKLFSTDSKREQYYWKHQRELIIDALLEMGQKKIEAVAQELQAGENAVTAASSMRKAFVRTTSSGERGTTGRGTNTTTTTKPEPEKGSLADWQKILREETEARDRLVAYTDQWNYHNDKVIEAQKEIDKLTKKVKELPEIVSGSAEEYDLLVSGLEKKLKNLEIGTPGYQQTNRLLSLIKNNRAIDEMNSKLSSFGELGPQTLSEWEEFLNILIQMRNVVPVDSEYFTEYTNIIDGTSKYINKLRGMNVDAPETDTWDKFTQSMSNVSTIVSSLTNTFKENAEVTAASILQMVSTALPAIGSLISAISALTATEAAEAGTAAVGKAVSSSKHWIEAVAAVASLGAVVAAAISAAKKPATQRFANGGIVGGSSFTGDRVSAQVNSGEMILNKSQQANLFKMANGEGQGKQVEFHISGTDLVGVLNNNTRKSRITR